MSDKPDNYVLTPMSEKEKIAEVTADSRNHMHEAIDASDIAILYVMDSEGAYRVLNYGDLTHQAMLLGAATLRLSAAIREAAASMEDKESTRQ